MGTLDTSQLVTVLQTAVGPVVVISGVGLLLLTMTNRLGRIVDRSRALAHQARTATGEEREKARAQLRILRERAELVRWAIAPGRFLRPVRGAAGHLPVRHGARSASKWPG